MSKSREKEDISQREITEYVYDKSIQLVMCTRGIRALWLYMLLTQQIKVKQNNKVSFGCIIPDFCFLLFFCYCQTFFPVIRFPISFLNNSRLVPDFRVARSLFDQKAPSFLFQRESRFRIVAQPLILIFDFSMLRLAYG